MPTIKEIAKASGVSVATVSNIINEKGKVSEETRIRVQKIIAVTVMEILYSGRFKSWWQSR